MGFVMNNDFKDFIISENSTPTHETNQIILNYVKNDLNPQHKKIFFKLLFLQGVIGLITMTFCPQFSLSLTNSYDLFHFFHHSFGHYICMIICGSIFIGSGALVATFILSGPEIKKIRSSSFLYYCSFSGIAVLSFMVLGAQVYLDLAGLWFIGASLSGVLIFHGQSILIKKITL